MEILRLLFLFLHTFMFFCFFVFQKLPRHQRLQPHQKGQLWSLWNPWMKQMKARKTRKKQKTNLMMWWTRLSLVCLFVFKLNVTCREIVFTIPDVFWCITCCIIQLPTCYQWCLVIGKDPLYFSELYRRC